MIVIDISSITIPSRFTNAISRAATGNLFDSTCVTDTRNAIRPRAQLSAEEIPCLLVTFLLGRMVVMHLLPLGRFLPRQIDQAVHMQEHRCTLSSKTTCGVLSRPSRTRHRSSLTQTVACIQMVSITAIMDIYRVSHNNSNIINRHTRSGLPFRPVYHHMVFYPRRRNKDIMVTTQTGLRSRRTPTLDRLPFLQHSLCRRLTFKQQRRRPM